MSGEKEAARKCVKFFKIGRHLGNVENLRERLYRLKVHHKTILWGLNTNFNTQLIAEICTVKANMEISSNVDLDKTEEHLMDIYERLVNDTMSLANKLLENSK